MTVKPAAVAEAVAMRMEAEQARRAEFREGVHAYLEIAAEVGLDQLDDVDEASTALVFAGDRAG